MNKLSVYHWSDLPRLIGVALLYAVSVKLALAYLTADGNISIVWIPSGIGLAVLLIGGRKYWPAIFIGALLAYTLWVGRPWVSSVFIAISNVLEPLLCYWLLTQLHIKNTSFDVGFTRTVDYIWLSACAILAALMAASIGVMTLWLTGIITPAMMPVSLLYWWMGNTLGIFIVTPLVLIWRTRPSLWLSRSRIVETTCLFGFTFFFGQVIFLGWFNESLAIFAHAYWMFLFVTWGSTRFGRHGSLLIIVMVVLQGLVGAAQGVGYFGIGGVDGEHGLVGLWLYAMLLLGMGITLSLAMYERKQANIKIQRLSNIYAALSQCNQAIVRCTSEEELFPIICRDSVNFGGMKMAWIGMVDEASQQVKPVASYGDVQGYLQGITISVDASNPLSHGPTGTSIRENHPYWCQDFVHDPSTAAWHERGAIAGWASSASLPLQLDGKVVGAFTLYSTEVNAFDEDIRNLLIEMAMDISFALDYFDQERRRKLAETQLKLAQAETIESRDRYVDLYEFAPVGYFSISKQGLITQVNWKVTSMFGLKRNQINQHRVDEFVADEEKKHWQKLFLSMQDLEDRDELNFDMKFTRSDGSIFIANLNCLRMDNEDEQPILRVAMFDVTQLKQTEAARHEVELRLQATLDAIPDLLFELDLNGRYFTVHTPNHHLLAAPIEDLVGKTVQEVLPPEAAKVVMSALNEADEYGRSQGMQFELQVPEGLRWFELSVSKKSSQKSKDPHFILLSRDITKRKQAQIALQSSELHLRTIIDIEPECIKIVDANGRLKEMNPAGLAMIEAESQEQVVGHLLLELVAPEHQAAFAALHKRVLAGESGQLQFEVIGLKGRRRWLETHAVPMVESGEKVLLGVTRDITESKQAIEALRKGDEHFKAYFDHSMVGMAETSVEKGWVQINDRLCEILGYSKPELSSMTWTEITHPDDLASDLAEFNKLLSGEMNEYTLDKRFIHRDGHVVYAHIAVRCVRREDGSIDYFVAMVDDITERKLKDMELRIAAIAFESQEGMMVTDANKKILKVNKAFTTISGYTEEEAIGQTPRLVNSGHHHEDFYASMWQKIAENGCWDGEVWNRRKNGEVYPQHLTITAVKGDDQAVTNYVATFTDVTLRNAAEAEINHLAFYDALTRLPNRRLLIDRLNHALSTGGRLGWGGALLFLDLDHFKTLNDTLGHDVGDLLLCQVAERLTACTREGDTVARLGGDEFVVMLEDLSKQPIEAAAQAEVIANKILSAINQPYQLSSNVYQTTASIGVVLFSDNEQSQDSLLKHADIAMYQAKKMGRNTLCFFDPNMQEAINARAALEADLRKAIRNKQFELYYQIQVDRLGRGIGAEGLIRWIHPKRGIIAPLEFIPLAEDTGMILIIGKWVLEAACAQLKTWQTKPSTQSLTLSINVSAKQFYQADFATQVITTVKRYGINAMQLKLELTESILLEHIDDTIIKMKELQKIGVQFSLDDFGTGYSSLQYLKLLPLYQLKIDRSFVRDIVIDSNDQAIVRTVVAMAQTLNLDVIAEGVETEVQREILANCACNSYQGFLFGKAMPIEQFDLALKSS